MAPREAGVARKLPPASEGWRSAALGAALAVAAAPAAAPSPRGTRMPENFKPEAFAQRQLDAYNDRDLDRFVRE
ncbi:MAG: hypothetical protein ACK5WG_12565, partial [Betaproteobacteria bacterium]